MSEPQVTVKPNRVELQVAVSQPSITINPQRVALVAIEQDTTTLEISKQGPAGPPGQGEAPVEQSFTGQVSITVDHHRGYRPIVSLTDLAGDEIDAAVEHLSLNAFAVLFNVPQSGQITYF